MQKLFKFVERNLGIISVTATVLGVAGSYLLSCDVTYDADGAWHLVYTKELLYPFAHGVKVLWGVDSYDRPWAELTSNLQRLGYVLFEVARCSATRCS